MRASDPIFEIEPRVLPEATVEGGARYLHQPSGLAPEPLRRFICRFDFFDVSRDKLLASDFFVQAVLCVSDGPAGLGDEGAEEAVDQDHFQEGGTAL